MFRLPNGLAAQGFDFGLAARRQSLLIQLEGWLMAELQQVLVGGDRRLVREYHDDRREPVAPPLALPQQPLLDESSHGLPAGLADELKVRGVPGSLLQGGCHAPFKGVKLVVLIEARPDALGA